MNNYSGLISQEWLSSTYCREDTFMIRNLAFQVLSPTLSPRPYWLFSPPSSILNPVPSTKRGCCYENGIAPAMCANAPRPCAGLHGICFCFMISALLKKPKTTCFAVFVLIFSFGALSLLTLINLLPAALEWILSLCCPFAFGAAISKVECYALFGIGNATLNVARFQNYGRYFYLSDLMYERYVYVLIFDSVLYVLLTIYFDKVVPDKYGVPYPATFFLKKSYWRRSGSSYTWDAPTNEQNHGNIFSDNAEPVPPEFDGKEAIRINNIKKTYKVKKMETEALRGLSLNIYEGQITAVLGHSGAGKTTLLNILSGLSQPSDGSTTICTYNISKREDMKQIREMLGVCPQFNIQFEFLTVKENLKTFAKIKGIPSKDVDKEVQNILTLLDIGAIQDTQANRLSGGQKRKLSLGITFLGDPQVLLLDEPTAGLDPYSRHLVWALLNERKAGRVTLFTTQFMDEADILAGPLIKGGAITCREASYYSIHQVLDPFMSFTVDPSAHYSVSSGPTINILAYHLNNYLGPESIYFTWQIDMCWLIFVPEEKMGHWLSFEKMLSCVPAIQASDCGGMCKSSHVLMTLRIKKQEEKIAGKEKKCQRVRQTNK
ncbi:ATP-binding cassette sub-family A member 10 [Varanus komodoensis]|nr:ATP-binding cassette sub-family A member 10 [Varanus komodoensis]